MSAKTTYESSPVNVRVKIFGLWTATLFVFAYVDIFQFYRADVLADIAAGKVSAFTIGQGFLLFTTAYIVLPSLMVFLTLVLPPRVNRIVNMVLSVLYALTIAVAAIGEWTYFVIASLIEIVLLAAIAYLAWTWPKVSPGSPTQSLSDVRNNSASRLL